MSGVSVQYVSGQAPSDPATTPVTIIGQARHLASLAWENVRQKLEPRVSQDVWSAAVASLSPQPTDSVSLYINMATVAALPTKVSRHNTNSRSHSITKIVKTCSAGGNECIAIVCEKRDLLASGAAVARAFPQFSRKTSGEAPDAFPRPPRSAVVSVEFLVVDPVLGETGPAVLTPADIRALDGVARGVQLTARIVDTPCNEMHTDAFLEEVKTVCANLSISPVIIRGEELKDRGFGGIYGVGKASDHPPALAVLSHRPPGATRSIAWVGKGIVYDTGGLSIKAKTAMPGMKRDCGGAAAILGAFMAAVENGFSENLHAVLCLAENSVGPLATRPDDIHTLYSGRTVEINNTDAEGRLVLADGVAYAAKDLKADIVLDMCTLTGAQGISTGRYHASHMSNKAVWEEVVSEAGRVSGDLSFPAVYCPELHFAEFSSSVADMKNSVADRNNAQASCAGLFINANLGFDFPGVWIHVDMAAPAHSGERATGYGVALLSSLFGSQSSSSLLQAACPTTENEDNMDNGDSSPSSKSKKPRLK
jgi:probable aminopeptidase NPEPL1